MLCKELSTKDWNIEANDVQSFYNILENRIVDVVDKLAPMKKFSTNNMKFIVCSIHKNLNVFSLEHNKSIKTQSDMFPTFGSVIGY